MGEMVVNPGAIDALNEHIAYFASFGGSASLDANTTTTIKTLTANELNGPGVYTIQASYDFNAINKSASIRIVRNEEEYAVNKTFCNDGMLSVCVPVKIEAGTTVTIKARCEVAQTSRGWQVHVH